MVHHSSDTYYPQNFGKFSTDFGPLFLADHHQILSTTAYLYFLQNIDQIFDKSRISNFFFATPQINFDQQILKFLHTDFHQINLKVKYICKIASLEFVHLPIFPLRGPFSCLQNILPSNRVVSQTPRTTAPYL